jgi:hypothetical protein
MNGQIVEVFETYNENTIGIDKLSGLVSNFMKQLLEHIHDGGLNTSLSYIKQVTKNINSKCGRNQRSTKYSTICILLYAICILP